MSLRTPSQQFHIPGGEGSERVRLRIDRFLAALPADRSYDLTLVEHRPKRSLEQNRLLWALYQQILEKGGNELAGWEKDDLHSLFLGEHFGWETLSGMGRKRIRPIQRSSELNKQDFTDFIEFVVRYMAQRGVVLTLPGEDTYD